MVAKDHWYSEDWSNLTAQSAYNLWPLSAHQQNAIWMAFLRGANSSLPLDAYWVMRSKPSKGRPLSEMSRLIWGFAGRTGYCVGFVISPLSIVVV